MSALPDGPSSPAKPPASAAGADDLIAGGHELLFAAETPSCDACGDALEAGDDDRGSLNGEGGYLWSRGGEAWLEPAPLCPTCASAIGLAAMARWEIEEEEG